MMNTALMAFCGFSFIGALTVCGSMELILERIMKHIHGTGQLITLTVALGVVMITVIGEATVTFLMIGGMFRPEYIKRGLESKNLSRSLGIHRIRNQKDYKRFSGIRRVSSVIRKISRGIIPV